MPNIFTVIIAASCLRNHCCYIETWIKWPTIDRRYFLMQFGKWKMCILSDISLKFALKGWIDNNSTLVLVMPYWYQAKKYLSHRWPRSMTANGVTMSQCKIDHKIKVNIATGVLKGTIRTTRWYVPGVRHLAGIAFEYQRNTFTEHRNIAG